MGCATAYHLLRLDDRLQVALIEMDQTYARASTTLSDGNLRVQFNIKENIQISLYGLEVLARFADELAVDDDRPDPGFRQQGNLFVIDAASRDETRAGLALQQRLGGQVEWLSPEQVRATYPLYENPNGCVGGTLGRQDGTMSPLAVLHAYRKKAGARGARFIQAEVAAITRDGIRQDAWANAHRVPVEEAKPEDERGTYLCPIEHGQLEELSLHRRRLTALAHAHDSVGVRGK